MEIKTAVIGSGPAGLTAAIYLARANLNPTLYAGSIYGGQLMITSEVENFPGFPDGIQGPDLMHRMIEQAKKFGTNIIYKDVRGVDFLQSPFHITTSDSEDAYNGVIVATGASAKWLGLASEKKLIGRGVSSCATCDGAFFREKIIAIVGGGDSAMEEAIFLTRFATKVYLLHRRDNFRASKYMITKALANPKIFPILSCEVKEVIGETKVEGIEYIDLTNNKLNTLQLDGLFIAIGHTPNTTIFSKQLVLLSNGYIKVNEGTKTSIEGIFSAGDVDDYRYRQAITAAGEGCKAALDLEKYLEEIHL